MDVQSLPCYDRSTTMMIYGALFGLEIFSLMTKVRRNGETFFSAYLVTAPRK